MSRIVLILSLFLPSVSFAMVAATKGRSHRSPHDICAEFLTIGETPSAHGPIVTTAPIFKTERTRMESATGYALLLAYQQIPSGKYMLYHIPVFFDDLKRHPDKLRDVNGVLKTIVTKAQFQEEIATWVDDSVGQVRVRLEEKIEGTHLDYKISFSKFTSF